MKNVGRCALALIKLAVLLFVVWLVFASLQQMGVPYLFEIGLLLAVAVAVLYLYLLARRVAMLRRVMRQARQRYSFKFRLCSPLGIFPILGKYARAADLSGRFAITVVFIRRRGARCHFAAPDKIEIYVGNREALRSSRSYNISPHVTEKLRGAVEIRGAVTERTLYLFSRAPMDVTCADPKAGKFLANGESFFECCSVSTVGRFVRGE